MSKRFLAVLLSFMVGLAACQSPAVTNTPRPGRTRTRVPAGSPTPLLQDTPTVGPTTAAADSSSASTPQPTFDFQGFILTQAYSKFTPPPGRTSQPQTTVVTPAVAATSSVPLDTATPHFAAPASVVVSGPVSIANAINKATCVINGVGDCTPTLAQGASVYVTWTLGIQGSQAFKWGNAAVVFQKDGQPFKWLQANNSAQKPPEAGQISTLAVGDQAVFRGGLDNIQPGAYSAKLVICLASVEQCNAGAGWQDVGGDTVQFAVNP